MVKNGLEKDIWLIIFKELSDKKISYAVCKNTYPQKQTWSEYHSHKLSIALEDPDRPPLPGSNVPWSCFLKLECANESFSISIDLNVYLPIAVDIQSVLSIIDHPYIGEFPSLIIENLPSTGKCYCINIEGSHNNSILLPFAGMKEWLHTRINAVNGLIKILYKIEEAPEDKKLIDDLIEYLVEI